MAGIGEVIFAEFCAYFFSPSLSSPPALCSSNTTIETLEHFVAAKEEGSTYTTYVGTRLMTSPPRHRNYLGLPQQLKL